MRFRVIYKKDRLLLMYRKRIVRSLGIEQNHSMYRTMVTTFTDIAHVLNRLRVPEKELFMTAGKRKLKTEGSV